MRETHVWIVVLLCSLLALPAAAATYRWVDGRKGLHFTDDISTIPPSYRSQAIPVGESADSSGVQITESAPVPKRQLQQRYSTTERRVKGESKTKKEKLPGNKGSNTVRHRPHRQSQGVTRAQQSAVESQSPARKAQNQVEENLRRMRQQLDNSQQPARSSQERNEDDSRKRSQGSR